MNLRISVNVDSMKIHINRKVNDMIISLLKRIKGDSLKKFQFETVLIPSFKKVSAENLTTKTILKNPFNLILFNSLYRKKDLN